MTLNREEILLLREALQRFTRSLGGDLSREKSPSQENKVKMKLAIELGDKFAEELT